MKEYINSIIADRNDDYEIHDKRINELTESSKNTVLYIDENMNIVPSSEFVKDVVDRDGKSIKNEEDNNVSLSNYATLQDIESKENLTNKIDNFNYLQQDNTKYPTAWLVKTSLDKKIDEPTEKEQDSVLTYNGAKWVASKSLSDMTLVGITVVSPPNKTFYNISSGGTATVDISGIQVMASYDSKTHQGAKFQALIAENKLSYSPKEISFDGSSIKQTITISFKDGDIQYNSSFEVVVAGPLNDASWNYIDELSQSGNAANVWDIGDTKSIVFDGKVHDVFIMEIGHSNKNEQISNNITFGMFITFDENKKHKLLGLTDAHYSEEAYGVNTYYAMNPSNTYCPTGTNEGGWEHSSMRQNVLGSWSKNNPENGTVMSKLPGELRSVLKVIPVYTDNDGNKKNLPSSVTKTDDYLPLLNEYEVFGSTNLCNENESFFSNQYEFFKNGNLTYIYDISQQNIVYSWLRSPDRNTTNGFCMISGENPRAGQTKPELTSGLSYWSYAIMPIFRV